MLTMMGAMMILAGFIMLVLLVKQFLQPKVTAYIETIHDQYAEDRPQNKKYRHAFVRFSFDGKDFSKTVLLKTKSNPGDNITLCISPTNEYRVQHYSPLIEFMVMLLLFAIGYAMIIFSFYLSDKISNF